MTTSIVTRGLDQLGDLLRAVTPDHVGRAPPCSEWTVADLSDHIVAGMATMASGGQPDWTTFSPAEGNRTQSSPSPNRDASDSRGS